MTTSLDRDRNAHVVVVGWPTPAFELGDLARELVDSVADDVRVFVPHGHRIPRTATLETAAGGGLAVALNELVAANPGADVVVAAEPCRFPQGWLESLQAAAYADATVAGAVPLLGGSALFDAFTLPRQSSPPARPLHPRIFRLRGHCCYIRAQALELVGPFSESVEHPAAVLDEYSARCVGRGLGIVLADGVLVERLAPVEPEQVNDLHTWFAAARAEEDALDAGPLRRSLVATRANAAQLSVTIDARSLGPRSSGTETYAAGLIFALAQADGLRVRAIVRDDLTGGDLADLTEAGVATVRETEARSAGERTDIAHRPQQVFVPEDLTLLRRTGERVVVSHLDLIAYRNPSYHASREEWQRYRRLTRLALGAVDHVVFLSEHARRDALGEELIEERWTSVVGSGIGAADAGANGQRPPAVPADRPFVLVLGADYFHKNRPFALRLADRLRAEHGWDGLLVLAGRHVPHGGSAAAEAELLRDNPELAARTLDIGSVTSEERNWLLANTRAVLCPSVYEGFGLVPLESAAAGVPCVFAAATSLAEIAQEAASIVPWDATATARRVRPLLDDGEERRHHLESLRAALERFEWKAVVADLTGAYRTAVASPYRSSVPRAWEELVREQLVVDLEKARRDRDAEYEALETLHKQLDADYQDLLRRIRHGHPLIDEDDGLLTPEQQRGLVRVASRRWLRGPLLGPVGWLGGIRAKRDDPGD